MGWNDREPWFTRLEMATEEIMDDNPGMDRNTAYTMAQRETMDNYIDRY